MKKIRIRFSKHGAVKYIGHLDVMRYFQKTIRRAGINVSYTGGYSPHQIMTFAAPLGVGVESDGEYMDIGVEDESPDCSQIKEALNKASVPEIRILSVKLLPGDACNAMASVYASSYEVSFYDDKASNCPDTVAMTELVKKMKALDHIIYHKETKKTTRDIDLKNLIYDLHIKCMESPNITAIINNDDNAAININEPGNTDNKDLSETRLACCDIPVICMIINSSSADSIKPQFVMEYMCDMAEIKLPENALKILRTDMYTLGENGELVSLGDIGE